MEEKDKIDALLKKIDALEEQLHDANNLVDSIRDGSVDAFIVNKDGRADIYTLESIDYTYRILIEKFGEGALSVSPEGLILYCNFYFSKLIDLPLGKIIGSYFQSHVQEPEEFEHLLKNLSAGLSKGKLQLIAKNKLVPVYISLTSLQPHLPAIGMIITDETLNKKHETEIYQYQKKLEQKINELNTMNTDLEQFVHIISHDIKEPLRKIVSYGGRLKQEFSETLADKGLKSLNIIHDATMRLNLLVDDLVQYSFSSQKKTSFADVNLNKIVSDVRDDIEILLKETRAQISVDTLPEIKGSEVQMRQLFSNLIINAIKYARKDVIPAINISSALTKIQNKNYHKITIADNGIGIEEQYLQKIFTIFQRLHSTAEYSGTGIGLAICKKIIENHGGSIEAESVLNQGSKFSLYLPAI